MKMSNKHIAAIVTKKNTRNAVLAVRQQFKGKDIVNVRECLIEGENEFSPTKGGFTIPAANFAEFFKSLRKFGRAAGLLGKNGDDDFKVKDFDDVEGNEDEIVIGKAEKDDDEKSGKTGIKRKAKDLEAIAKAKRPNAEEKAKGKKTKDEDDDGDDDSGFDMKAFKKAIKTANKNDDDTALAKAVVMMYKGNRKLLKEKLPKHAVNALEKSLASKKDEALMTKAVVACQKHIIEKDFSL